MPRAEKSKPYLPTRVILIVVLALVAAVVAVTCVFIKYRPAPTGSTQIVTTGSNVIPATTSTKNFEKTVIQDEVQGQMETVYYDISGRTKAELIQQMTERGPDCDDECFAWTEWAIDWVSPISGRADCEPVSVVVRVTYTLPRWVDKDSAPASLQREWEAYEKKLLAHEEHHKDITVKYAQIFLDKIQEINQQDYQSCRELEDLIGEYHATGEIIMGCTEATAAYDRETNHGALEGIVL